MARPAEPSRLITLGWTAVAWIEAMLVHGPGDVAGEPVELDDEFTAFVLQCYRLDEHGRRVYDEGLISRPKGRAKTELAGFIGCFDALGPSRFDGWDANGDPVGRPVRGPFVRCLATEESQAGDTAYRNIAYMLTHGAAAEEYRIDVGNDWQTSTRIFLPDTGGEVRYSSGSDSSKDGGKESLSIAEETHLYVTDALRGMYDTVQRNTMKRKAAEPWMLQASTMYEIGADSICERTHKAAARKTPRLLLDHRQAPPIDLDSLDSTLAGLRHVYGAFADNMDLPKLAAYMMDPRRDRPVVIRYFGNRPAPPSSSYWDREAWDRGALPDTVQPGEEITLGFDGSNSKDETWLRACRVSDGYLFTPRFPDGSPMRWKRPEIEEQAKGWTVPRAEVRAGWKHVGETYKVALMYADPPYWRTELDELAGEWGEEVVVLRDTNQSKWMSAQLERLDTDVRAGEVLHDGDPEIAEHITNSKGEYRGGGKVIVKFSEESKIDGAMATDLAYVARADLIATRATTEPEKDRSFAFD